MFKTDNDIEKMVETELKWEPALDETDIAVKAKDGVVTLAGFTKSYMDKYHAEKAAKRVLGVKAVANDIQVKFPGGTDRADPEIARDAVAALKRDLPVTSEKLKAIVQNGWVTLEGDVEWDYARRMAESAVRPIKGVKGVTNSIHIKPKVSAYDLKLKIENAFRRSAEIDAHNITVETDGGTVTLRGKVRSYAEMTEAGRTAWRAPGVTEVRNLIQVDPSLQRTGALEPA